MKVRLSGPNAAISSALGLKSWVGNKSFPREKYFEFIDFVIERLAAISPDSEPEPRNIVTALVSMLDEEGALLARVMQKKSVEYDTDEKWLAVCTAAGWQVLAAYAKALEDGSWSK